MIRPAAAAVSLGRCDARRGEAALAADKVGGVPVMSPSLRRPFGLPAQRRGGMYYFGSRFGTQLTFVGPGRCVGLV
jgi:hypothetical protein